MQLKIGSGANTLIINRNGLKDTVTFDAINSIGHSSICNDLSTEQAVEIVNALLSCLDIKSKVVTRSRYEIETV